MKLYQLTENYQNLWDLVEDETIDLSIVETALKTVEGAIQEKAQNLAVFIKSLGADIEIIKAEEKRLADRRKALENKQSGIKNYLQSQLEMAKLDKIKTAVITVSMQNNPPAVRIIDEAIIPAQYKTIVPQTFTIDKKSIADDIKKGISVPGAESTQGRSLRIR